MFPDTFTFTFEDSMNQRRFSPVLEQCERRDLASAMGHHVGHHARTIHAMSSVLAGSHFTGTETYSRGQYFVRDTGVLVVNGVSQNVTLTGVAVLKSDGWRFDWSVQSLNLLTRSVSGSPTITTPNLQLITQGPGAGTQFTSTYVPNTGNTTNTLTFN